MSESKLYRISRRWTSSLQPRYTHWDRDLLYCGYDREEARRVFHAHTHEEAGGNYGSKATEIESEIIEDADTADFADDPTAEVAV